MWFTLDGDYFKCDGKIHVECYIRVFCYTKHACSLGSTTQGKCFSVICMYQSLGVVTHDHLYGYVIADLLNQL